MITDNKTYTQKGEWVKNNLLPIFLMLVVGLFFSYMYLFQGNLMKEFTPVLIFAVFIVLFGLWMKQSNGWEEEEKTND